METCNSCGVSLAPRDVLYTSEAKVSCADCYNKADLVDTDKRAARNIVKAAWASVGAGVISMCGPLAMLGLFTYFFIATAVLSAAFALQSIARGGDNDRFTKYLSSGQRVTVWVCSGIGLLLAGLAATGYAEKLAIAIVRHT